MISTARPETLAFTPAQRPFTMMRSSARALSSTVTFGLFAHALDQGPRDFRARLVAVRVHDPLARMRGLLAEREAAGRVGVEPRADRRELAHALRPLGDEHFDRRGVAQRRSGGERVEPVELGRVAGAERRGDAALRVRRRAVEERALGEHEHVAVLGCAPRGVQSRHARSR